MITDTLSVSVPSTDQASPLSGQITSSGTTRPATFDVNIPNGTTDQNIVVAIPHATMKTFVILSDKNCVVCVNAASTGSPYKTINLIAGWPYVWNASDGYYANPFTVDITGFYVTTTSAVRIRGRFLNA